MAKQVDVSYTGYGVFRHPEGLEGWNCGRLEIGGSNEDCIEECTIWTPPGLDPWDIVELYRKAQGMEPLVWE